MSSFNNITTGRYGKIIYNKHDLFVGRSFQLYGEFSEGEVDAFRQFIKPGMVVLDIGANIGAHTLFFSQAVGPQGTVHAFEPQRLVFQVLAGNMALNSVTNVFCHLKALGETNGQIAVPSLDFNVVNNFGGLELEMVAPITEPVDIIKLDDFSLTQLHFLKLDVEGMERKVLVGGVKMISRFRPIMYVENDREKKKAELIQFIDQLGYDMYWHLPPLYNPNNFTNNPKNVFGNIVSINMLCIPKEMPVNIVGLEKVEEIARM